MRLPKWWTEMGWDFRFCVLFTAIYGPIACWMAVQP